MGCRDTAITIRSVRSATHEAIGYLTLLLLWRVRYIHILRKLLVSRLNILLQFDTDHKLSIEDILGASSLKTTAYFAPMAIGGIILATVGGLILHLLSGTILMTISGTGYIVSMLLFAVIPESPNYWGFIFPAMICATLGVDLTFNVSNVFITTNMPKARQGLAGALINSVVFLGISFFLGIADISVSATSHLGKRESYKVAFWLGVGCAGISLLLLAGFVRIKKAESDLTVEEKLELEAELMMVRASPTISNEQDAK
jgi:MFS family permease